MSETEDGSTLDVAALARELQVTEMQIRDAIEAVGTSPSDIELHLKGTRASTNEDKIAGAGADAQNG